MWRELLSESPADVGKLFPGSTLEKTFSERRLLLAGGTFAPGDQRFKNRDQPGRGALCGCHRTDIGEKFSYRQPTGDKLYEEKLYPAV